MSRIYERSLKNCSSDPVLWKLYLIELETQPDCTIEVLRETYEKAENAISKGDKLDFEVWFDLKKSMLSTYSRAIKPVDVIQFEWKFEESNYVR